MDFDSVETFNYGNLIDIIGIIVNFFLAIWIVRILQNNLTNKRYLKDHLIQEIKDLRSEYKKFLNDLNAGNLKPRKILPWFKLMNIKVQDTMEVVSEKYNLDQDLLKSYQVELRELVTEFEEFNLNYKDNKVISLQESSLRELIQFQQNNHSKFNALILEINDK